MQSKSIEQRLSVSVVLQPGVHANLKKIRAAKKNYPDQDFRMAVPRLVKKVYLSTEYLSISPSNVHTCPALPCGAKSGFP